MSPGSAKIPGEKCLDLTVIECITVQSLGRFHSLLIAVEKTIFFLLIDFVICGQALFLLGTLPLLTDIP